VPVVAFDAPASNEIIAHNETGLLAPLFDSSQLAEKIIYLLQNPSEGKRLASNGYERYTAYFNTTRMIKETAAWYRTIIAD
jgi:glycosyltransferase involved in cell wall biosynthesis